MQNHPKSTNIKYCDKINFNSLSGKVVKKKQGEPHKTHSSSKQNTSIQVETNNIHYTSISYDPSWQNTYINSVGIHHSSSGEHKLFDKDEDKTRFFHFILFPINLAYKFLSDHCKFPNMVGEQTNHFLSGNQSDANVKSAGSI